MSWIDSAHFLGVAAVAEILGIEQGRPAGGRSTYSCPACGQKTRHTKSRDKRGAIGLTSNGQGWRCFQCDQRGDGIDLVSVAINGRRLVDCCSEEKNEVKTWFEDLSGDRPFAQCLPSPSPAMTSPNYPPKEEIELLWKESSPADEDSEVVEYLRRRKICSENVSELDLARSLPSDLGLPSWTWGPKGNWSKTGHRIVLPLFDAQGIHRSFIARTVTKTTPKSLSPSGFERRGLVMADGLGRQLLEKGEYPPWWDRDVRLFVSITEGEIDFLCDATESEPMADSGHGPAVFGIFEGGWTKDHADRIPDGSVVLISTDSDETGSKYAEQIISTFTDRRIELQMRRP